MTDTPEPALIRDPRNPDDRYMVHVAGSHPSHRKLRKTLALLRIAGIDRPIYFVVEGMAEWPQLLSEMQDRERYFYEEHTCPTNFIRIPLIADGADHDPHGLFEFVEAVWMTDEYLAGDDEPAAYLSRVFPQLQGAP